MKNIIYGILLDTRSIQRYVFSSSKMQTNIGASFLVDEIFECMRTQLKERFDKACESEWEENCNLEWDDKGNKIKSKIKMSDGNNIECEIVYIGGGNMLILINKGKDSKTVCQEIVCKWSKTILLHAPGLKTGVAIGEVDLNDFQESLTELYRQSKRNQNSILPQVDLPYTGLTLECDISGKVATSYLKENDSEDRMISVETKSKLIAYKEYADKKICDIAKLDTNKYKFAYEIDKIGNKEAESYVCIAHIDGNNMGVKFSSCDTPEERRFLSKKIADNVKIAFKDLVNSIIKEYEQYEKHKQNSEYDIYDESLFIQKDNKDGKYILPFRPIIIGGDDITFICAGRVGLEYTRRFIEKIIDLPLLNETVEAEEMLYKKMVLKNNKIRRYMSCCAGMAIVPTKYPFYRAYQLAEQLCSSAKKKSRDKDDSLIDFAILHGDMYPSLEQLRDNEYKINNKRLNYGPYFINKRGEDSSCGKNQHLDDLLNLANKLNDSDISINKVKELRYVLTKDEHTQELFLKNWIRSLKDSDKLNDILPNAVSADFWEEQYDSNGYKEKVTRFIDAIEIIDFLLKRKDCDNNIEKVK